MNNLIENIIYKCRSYASVRYSVTKLMHLLAYVTSFIRSLNTQKLFGDSNKLGANEIELSENYCCTHIVAKNQYPLIPREVGLRYKSPL